MAAAALSRVNVMGAGSSAHFKRLKVAHDKVIKRLRSSQENSGLVKLFDEHFGRDHPSETLVAEAREKVDPRKHWRKATLAVLASVRWRNIAAERFQRKRGCSLVLALFEKFGQRMEALRDHAYFTAFIILCIVAAGVLVGIQTYDEMADDPNLLLLDDAILYVFCFEIVVKILAESTRPWLFFNGQDWRWNNFDLAIVVFCLPIPGFLEAVNPSFLRLLRLARITKLFNKVPQLRVIVSGLVHGVKSIVWILLLLLLIYYLFAVAGVLLFKENDPWHFGNLPIAMITLFRAGTLEDWSDCMYINYFGCADWTGNYEDATHRKKHIERSERGNNVTKVRIDIVGSYQHVFFDLKCVNSTAKPVLSVLFFLVFLVVGSFVMLSLFVGAVTMGMNDSIKAQEAELKAAQKAMRAKHTSDDEKNIRSLLVNVWECFDKELLRSVEATKPGQRLQGITKKMIGHLQQAKSSSTNSFELFALTAADVNEKVADPVTGLALGFTNSVATLALRGGVFADSQATSATEGMQTLKRLSDRDAGNAVKRAAKVEAARGKFRAKVCEVFDCTELTMDAFSALVRDEFQSEMAGVPPSDADLRVAFNLADTDKSGLVNESEFMVLYELIMAGTVTGIGKSNDDGHSRRKASDLKQAITSARARGEAPALTTQGKQVTVNGVPVVDAAARAARMERMDGAVAKFRAKVAEVFDCTELTRQAFKELITDEFLPVLGEGAAVVPTEADLSAAFDLADVDRSGLVDEDEFMVLFEMIMAGTVAGISTRGNEAAGRKQLDVKAALSLATALKSASIRESFRDSFREGGSFSAGGSRDDIRERQEAAAAKRAKHNARTSRRKAEKAYEALGSMCRKVETSPWFTHFITVAIVVASCLVGIGTEPKFSNLPLLRRLEGAILGVFVVECLVKVCARIWVPMDYFRDSWNLFDFGIVTASLAQLVLSTMVTDVDPAVHEIVSGLQMLRLLRILKLAKQFKQLRIIVEALISGFSSITYISLILFIFFYVFAIVAMLLFKKNDPRNFGTLHMALFSLFRAATMEDWTDLMYIQMFGCDLYGYSGFEDECKTPRGWGYFASLYFIVFIVLGALILLSLFIGVVTTAMSEAEHRAKRDEQLANNVEMVRATLGMSEEDVKAMSKLFEAIDLDREDSISFDELQCVIKIITTLEGNMLEEHVLAIFDEVDTDGSGVMEFPEFIRLLLRIHGWFVEDSKQRSKRDRESAMKADVISSIKALQAGHSPVGPSSPSALASSFGKLGSIDEASNAVEVDEDLGNVEDELRREIAATSARVAALLRTRDMLQSAHRAIGLGLPPASPSPATTVGRGAEVGQ